MTTPDLREATIRALKEWRHCRGLLDRSNEQAALDLAFTHIEQALAAPANSPVAWGAFHFCGPRNGQLYAHCKTKEEIEGYIQQVEQRSDSLSLRAAPIYTHSCDGCDEQGSKSREAAAEPLHELCRAGRALSNIAYNLAQSEGVVLSAKVCETMNRARVEWDTAISRVNASAANAEAQSS